MEMRRLGTHGPCLPPLGLGCMGMSESYPPHDDAEALATIDLALDRGITMLDTSDAYGVHGENETFIGNAIAHRRRDVFLATKFGNIRTPDGGHAAPDGRPAYVRSACEASLKRLRVDAIDLYYQHRVDPTTPIEDTVGAMSDLVRAGKVRYLGLSEATPAVLRRAHAVHPIAAVQMEYSLFSREVEGRYLAVLRELGIALVAYSPLGRGLLTGRIRRPEDLDPSDKRAHAPRFATDNLPRNMRLVATLESMAAARGCSASQLALAWLLAQGQEIFAIPGTKKRRFLEHNLAALDVCLDAADLNRIAAAFDPAAVAGHRYPQVARATLAF